MHAMKMRLLFGLLLLSLTLPIYGQGFMPIPPKNAVKVISTGRAIYIDGLAYKLNIDMEISVRSVEGKNLNEAGPITLNASATTYQKLDMILNGNADVITPIIKDGTINVSGSTKNTIVWPDVTMELREYGVIDIQNIRKAGDCTDPVQLVMNLVRIPSVITSVMEQPTALNETKEATLKPLFSKDQAKAKCTLVSIDKGTVLKQGFKHELTLPYHIPLTDTGDIAFRNHDYSLYLDGVMTAKSTVEYASGNYMKVENRLSKCLSDIEGEMTVTLRNTFEKPSKYGKCYKVAYKGSVNMELTDIHDKPLSINGVNSVLLTQITIGIN